jgi:spermidine synthase
MQRPSPPPQSLFSILTCFFLSGAAGLIYQVAWGKSLGLIFGHTAYAISTVLAVFMAGLTAGSIYIGRWAEHRANPIRIYARLELLVAAFGALSIPGLLGVRYLYVGVYSILSGFPPVAVLLRLVGVGFVLFIPTFLMGGTFPVLVQGTTRHSAELASRVSLLYWVNTSGAVAGTLLCGFVLLPAIGLRLSIVFAVLLNVASAVMALRTLQASNRTKTANRSPVPAIPSRATPQPSSGNFLLFAFAIVGCTAFAYEIAWTRLLAISIGSSTYAFTLMLAAFLTGTVIGSVLFQRFAARSRVVSLSTFSSTQTWTGIAAVSSLLLFQWIPAVVPLVLHATHQAFAGIILAQFIASALAVLPVAIVFGFNFPAVIVLIENTATPGVASSAVVGRAYGANTLGAIVGALVTGFWLVPLLGSFRVIGVVAAINLLLALILAVQAPRRATARLAVNAAGLAFVLFVAASSAFYNKSLVSLSALLYGNTFQGHLTLSEIAQASDLVFMADGANDSVAVFRSDNYVALRVNGKTDASTGDARTQLLLAHLGAAFHPAPRRALIIGFGSGMTASALARYPSLERIDCVEIEPAVLRAAPYLQSLNRGVLSDPRLHLIFDDARNFLLTSRQKYDLIISEPSNPWIAGVATLFTVEYYHAVRQRLAPGGIFVQWLQAYSLSPADLRMVAASLAPHFPEVTLWRGDEADLLFLCRTDSPPFSFQRLHALWENQSLRADFELLDVHQPEGLVAYYLLDDSAVRSLGTAAPLNTDDRTLLEYHAPKTMLAAGLSAQNRQLLSQFRSSPLPANLQSSETGAALEAGSATALDLDDRDNAGKFLAALESQPPSAARSISEGRFSLLYGSLAEAKSSLEAALQLAPGSPEAMHWLAVVDHRAGDETAARSMVNRILQSHPGFLPALTDEMQFAADDLDYKISYLAQLKRMALMPDPPASEFCRLGAIWVKLGSAVEAEEAFLKGIIKDPYSYACNLDLGELDRGTGRYALAQQQLELVVRLYPDYNPAVFRSLAMVYQALEEPDSAAAILRKGLRLFPDDPALQQALAASSARSR